MSELVGKLTFACDNLLKEVDILKDINDQLYKQIESMQNTRTQSQCELYDELYKAALGLSHGVDWNRGTHAIEHGYRDKLLSAVMKLKEQGQ